MRQPNQETQARDVSRRTIDDFGTQWTRFTENKGYYASVGLLAGICGPLLELTDIKGCRVADIGSGTGRIVQMLLHAGAASVVAIEPSQAVEVLRRNTEQYGERVEIIHASGEAIGRLRDLDLILSIGVLHHIADPSPVVRAAYQALRPGGRMMIWLYGQEGNELYLSVFGRMRAVTTRLPHPMLVGLSAMLNLGASVYSTACRYLPLPMAAYMRNHFSRLDQSQRRLTIYDQLNPAYAKYYSEMEAQALLADNGFVDVRCYHRHGYSWSVIGRKPRD